MVPNEKRRLYLIFGVTFVLGVCAAFAVAWLLFRPPPPPPERVLAAEELTGFFRAVEQNDYAAMSELGTELFREDTRIPDSKALFAEYETTSYPPNTVYAFYSGFGLGLTRRVLLTMDAEDRVVSFLAEEMEVTR